MRAIVIHTDGAVAEVQLPEFSEAAALSALQFLVDGYIEMVRLPDRDDAAALINDMNLTNLERRPRAPVRVWRECPSASRSGTTLAVAPSYFPTKGAQDAV